MKRPQDLTTPLLGLVAAVLITTLLVRDSGRPPGDRAGVGPTDTPTATERTEGGTGAGKPPGKPGKTKPPKPKVRPAYPQTPPGQTCEAVGAARTFTVLTFNIHSARGRLASGTAAIAAEIAAWGPDVVLLQEVDNSRGWTGNTNQAAAIATRLGFDYAYGGNPLGDGQIGNAILSRYPITGSRQVFLPRQPGQQTRSLLQATVDLDGRKVSIYTTHYQHTRGNIRDLQMRAVLNAIADDPQPKLLGGDFNAPPTSTPLRMSSSVLFDVWRFAGEGVGATVPADAPRSRIDYVLADTAFVPLSADVLFSSVSDHRAVRAEMDMPPQLDCTDAPDPSTGPTGDS